MCGIAGFTGFVDNVALAKKACELQQHRGPDNQTVWSDNIIAFAHQRLSIIDLSEAANQPFHKEELVTIFNGEIYNYRELQEKLRVEKQVNFITSSDTEVVVEMYRHYGPECLDFLIGMFAFAIYNKKDGSLFIVRDHFGIKPLFYTQINDGFAFSSELKTLVGLPGFCKQINPKALVSSLNYLWVSGNDTMFRNCYKLPPAHYLTYTRSGGIQIRQYWQLNSKPAENGKYNEQYQVKALKEVMAASVKRHMVADVPVSSFLSGGLDSSLIAVLAKNSNENLSVYTITTSDQDKRIEKMPDDEKYAAQVAATYHLDHHKIKISPDIVADLPRMVRTLDEPIGDPAAINTYLICKAAREQGVKVLLSGMGADEIFFGYRRQKATLMAMRYNRLPGFIKSITAAIVRNLPVRIMGRGLKTARWAKRFMGFATLPVDEAYMRSYSYYDAEQLRALLKPEYWPAIELLRAEHKAIFNDGYQGDTINQICQTDLHMFMLGLNLSYTDRASMAASVEVRVPFIDKLVISHAMQIPGEMKIRGGESKYVLKKAAESFLSKDIIYRPKASFGAPIRSWISGSLRGMVDELLSEKQIEKRGFLNYSYVKKLVDNDRKGIEDNAYQIYQLLTLELWCREFLDK